MGFFDKLFRPIMTKKALNSYFDMMTAYQPAFYSRAGGLYEMDKTRAAVNSFAMHCSKLKPHVTGRFASSLEREIQFKMNPWQTTSQFLARTATILECDNTCFLIPILNERGYTVGAYPVVPSRCDVVEDAAGTLFLRYEFSSGKKAAVEINRCGLLVKMQYKNDFFGESNAALDPTMDLINVQNQGIQAGIEQSAAVRFIVRLATSQRREDIEAEQERFRKLNLSAENNGGALMVDSKYAEVKQIESRPFVVDADQLKVINENVYEYFGTNEKILRNEWDEATWTAFYEGKIEPFALQLSLALTGMFFTPQQIRDGNEITFSANRLQFASTKDKVSIITQLFDRGMLNQDEGREIMQMPPLPDGKGKKYYIRGEYVAKQEGEETNAGKSE